MARKRMIDPSIWTSDQVTGLTLRQRLIFIGLISNADDDGRLRGEARKVKGLVFPTDDILSQDIEDDLLSIAETGLIRRWQRNGEIYIELPKWKTYQKMNYKTDSHLPVFDESTDEILTKRFVNVSPQEKRREVSKEKKELKISANAEFDKNSPDKRTPKQRNWDSKLEIVKESLGKFCDPKTIPYQYPGEVLKLVSKEVNLALGAIEIFQPNGDFAKLTGKERLENFIKWLNDQVHANPNWRAWLEQGYKSWDRKNPVAIGEILKFKP